MGRGKTKNESVSAYDACTNPDIRNKVFMSKRTVCPEDPKERKAASFYSRYFLNSLKQVTITRNPFTLDDTDACKRFLDLTEHFQESTSQTLADISKNELLNQFLDFVEESNAIVCLKDDAKQFLPYRMLFPDVLKLYFFKMLYPRIFDFDLISKDKIIFKSDYIEKNFKTIYLQIEKLGMAIIYDAMLMAIETAMVEFIQSMKDCKIYIDPFESDMYMHMDSGFNTSKDPRIPLLRILKDSIFFLSRHYGKVYYNRNITEKRITTILKSDTFYSGKRRDESRIALEDVFRECHTHLNDDKLPFTRLLNLYYLNKRSYLFDLDIMNNNIEFMPYALEGIVTKNLLNSIIIENNDLLETDSCLGEDENESSDSSKAINKLDPKNQKKHFVSKLKLSSLFNNPNCILTNFSTRDYEVINYILCGLSKTFKDYYLKDNGEDIPPSKLAEIIQLLDINKLTPIISDMVAPFENLYINNVNYETVMRQRGI